MESRNTDYDLAFSFAGEHRDSIRLIKAECMNLGLRVFFDEDEKADSWGVDFLTRQRKIFSWHSLFVVPFISKEYFAKRYPRDEFESAMMRQLDAGVNREGRYILPITIGDPDIPDVYLSPTIGRLRMEDYTPRGLAELMHMIVGHTKVVRGGHVLAPASGAMPPGLVVELESILDSMGFTLASRGKPDLIRQVVLEHIPGKLREPFEELIAFRREKRIFWGPTRGIAFTTWGVRIRQDHERFDFSYLDLDRYSVQCVTEYVSSAEMGGVATARFDNLVVKGPIGTISWRIGCAREVAASIVRIRQLKREKSDLFGRA